MIKISNIFILLFFSYFFYANYLQLYYQLFSSTVSYDQFEKLPSKNITMLNIYNHGVVYVDLINNSPINFYYLNFDHLKKSVDNHVYHNKDINIYFKQSGSLNIYDIILYIALLKFLSFILESLSKNVIDKVDKDVQITKTSNTRLDDIAGVEEIKDDIMEFVEIIKNQEKYRKLGARLPKGALLVGPAGTGKTLLAKAIAGECNLPFIHAAGSDFNEIFVGVGSLRVKKLFETAKENKPCILFIDEIDALAHKRSSKSYHHDDRDNTLNALLVEMDGFNTEDGIVVIGATNRADILDPAIMRAGRFDRKIYFSLPARNDRLKIFSYYLNKIKYKKEISKEDNIQDIEEIVEVKLKKNGRFRNRKKVTFEIKKMEEPENDKTEVDELVEELTDITYGLNGADISNMINESAIIAGKNNQRYITRLDVLNAYEYIILGLEKKNYYLTDQEKTTVCYHEMGHAFLAHILKSATRPVQISAIPRGAAALGYTLSENQEKKLKTRNEIIAEIGVLCGGRIAEEIFLNDISTGASDDFEKATNLARDLIMRFVMSKEVKQVFDEDESYKISENSKKIIDDSTNRLIFSIYMKCRENMERYKNEIKILAEKLKRLEKMYKEDIDSSFKNIPENSQSLDYKMLLNAK